MYKQQGYTLVELLICLLICSLLLSLAAPSFSALLSNGKRTLQTNHFLGLLHYSRSSAVMNNRMITFCSGMNQCERSDHWSESLLVFVDSNGNGQLDEGETVLQHNQLDEEYSWRWSNFRKRHYLTYESNGTTQAMNGTFTLCKHGEAIQQVVISLSGRPRSQAPLVNNCL